MRYAIELIEKEIERKEILYRANHFDVKYVGDIKSLNRALDLILFNSTTKEQDTLIDDFNIGLDDFDHKKCKKAYDKLLKSLPEKHFYRRVLDMQIRQFPQERTN